MMKSINGHRFGLFNIVPTNPSHCRVNTRSHIDRLSISALFIASSLSKSGQINKEKPNWSVFGVLSG